MRPRKNVRHRDDTIKSRGIMELKKRVVDMLYLHLFPIIIFLPPWVAQPIWNSIMHHSRNLAGMLCCVDENFTVELLGSFVEFR